MHFNRNNFGKQGEYIEKKYIGDAIDLSIQIIGGGGDWGAYFEMGYVWKCLNQRDGGIRFALKRGRIVNIVHIKTML